MDLHVVECIRETLNKSGSPPFLSQEDTANMQPESVEQLVERIVEETNLANTFTCEKQVFIKYLARAAIHAFEEHGEIEDDAFFVMLHSALSRKPSEIPKWKDHIVDVNGVRRKCIVQNEMLMIKKDHGVLLPLVPLSVSVALEKSPKDKDYNDQRPFSREGMQRVLSTRALPDPQRVIRPKANTPRVRSRR